MGNYQHYEPPDKIFEKKIIDFSDQIAVSTEFYANISNTFLGPGCYNKSLFKSFDILFNFLDIIFRQF